MYQNYYCLGQKNIYSSTVQGDLHLELCQMSWHYKVFKHYFGVVYEGMGKGRGETRKRGKILLLKCRWPRSCLTGLLEFGNFVMPTTSSVETPIKVANASYKYNLNTSFSVNFSMFAFIFT